MFHAQAIIFAVKCAWAARAIIVEKCPVIWGVDTCYIIDRITDLFLYSKGHGTVTTNEQCKPRIRMLYNQLSLLFLSHVPLSLLLYPKQMAKRPSREARDREGEEQDRSRRRRGGNEDEEATSSNREERRDDSTQRQATRRSSRRRGGDGDAENRNDPQSSRGASRSLVCSPEPPRRHRSESRVANDRPRPSSSRDRAAVEEAPSGEVNPLIQDIDEEKDDDKDWKRFCRQRRNDEWAIRNGHSRRPDNWIDDDWEAWSNANPRRAERMRHRQHSASRPPPPPLSSVVLSNRSETATAPTAPLPSLGQMSDVSEEDDEVEVVDVIKSPGAGSAPPPNKVRSSHDKISKDIKHRDAREAAAAANTKAAEAFKVPKGKKTARKSTAPSSPPPPIAISAEATPTRYEHVGNGRYVPLDTQTSSSPSPPPHASRRVIAGSSNDESSPGRESQSPLDDPIYIRNKNKLEELRRNAPSAKAGGEGSSKSDPPPSKDQTKKPGNKGNKKKGLRMHPLSAVAQRAGALGPDASLASVLTFGLLGIHSTAAEYLDGDNALRATVVWQFGEGEDRQLVFRDMTHEERQLIPVSTNGERRPTPTATSSDAPEKKEENAEESDEEESDD